MRIILGIALALGLSSCGKPEASYHFNDSHMYASFIERLNQEGIEYRKAKEFTVFYPIDESEKIKEIADSVIAKYVSGCGGKFNDPGRQTAFESALKSRSIPYRIVVLDDGPWVVCPEQYRQESSIAFQAVLRGENAN